MPLRVVVHEVWMIGIGVQVILAVVLLARKTWQKYPVFTTYVFFNLFQAALGYAFFRKGMVFFYTFWVCEALTIFLGLALVREIFTSLFSPHPALRKLATGIFRVAVVALIVLACSAIYVQSGDARGITDAIVLATEAARIVQVGLIMFLFLSSSAFGLHWRQNVFGIALGLGTYAAVELVNVTLMAHVSPASGQAFSLVRCLAFDCSLLIWLGYILVPERATNAGDVPKRAQLEQWNQAVTELISR
jgi:hypothetical protein